MKRDVAILVFEDAEVLDFAGPFEVFSVASELHDHALFDVRIVAATGAPVRAVNGFMVVPNATFAGMRQPDILVIAGGAGTRRVMSDPELIAWAGNAAASAEIILSVCSGARILAALGLLDDLEVTTHHQMFDHIAELAPRAHLRPGARFVDTGKIITTGGISAGIDGAFHVVSRLHGTGLAAATARYMEYEHRAETG
ncbi:DJ-1/PfpI family protein [Sphingopyxis solisilvae]|uniref:DJ-1/PfpI family protein n=1 Tax=Sphingopyxis solisilvae TaxID=1886788 RepID=UPI001892A26C|nr:DJ-1/PfpI family protein [Sphingopyxis solisilvae]